MSRACGFAGILILICMTLMNLTGCFCNIGPCNENGSINNLIYSKESLKIKEGDIEKNRIRETAEISPVKNIPVEHGGKFFIAGAEIVYIKNGSIEWQSSEIRKYAKEAGKFYIATGSDLFCTDNHGSIIWKMTLRNSGTCSLENGELIVFTESGMRKFNPSSGKTIQ